jgi:hypothetical protein
MHRVKRRAAKPSAKTGIKAKASKMKTVVLERRVGSLIVRVSIDQMLDDAIAVVSRFPEEHGVVEGAISIRLSESAHLHLESGSSLVVGLPPSRDQSRTEIGIVQALCRFVGFIGTTKGQALMHASAVKTAHQDLVVFIDDGSSFGKTTCLLVAALDGGQYVADDFTFLNRATGYVVPEQAIPIHIRADVRADLQRYWPTLARVPSFALPTDLDLRQAHPQMPSAFVAPYPRTNSVATRRLSFQESKQVLVHALLAHIMKFMVPETDRVSLFVATDESRYTPLLDYFERLPEGLRTHFSALATDLARSVPTYVWNFRTAADVPILLKELHDELAGQGDNPRQTPSNSRIDDDPH